jgi:hypothetical protein
VLLAVATFLWGFDKGFAEGWSLPAVFRRFKMWIFDSFQWVALVGIIVGAGFAAFNQGVQGHRAEWLTVCGEVLVALAIFWELEQNRATEFISRVSQSKGRGRIYDAFASLVPQGHEGQSSNESRAQASIERNSLRTLSSEFYAKMKADHKLRQCCDEQLAVFAGEGYLLRKSLFYRHLMMRWYPHVIVRLWMILGAYFEDRMTTMSLDWDKSFIRLAFRSLQYLEDNGTKLRIEKRDGTGGIDLKSEDLRELEKRFRKLVNREPV